MRATVIAILLVLLSAGALSLSTGLAASPRPAEPTVFGKGAELHLLDARSPRTGEHSLNEAHAGTRVTAVGLGFHPGARVRIIYAMASTNFLLKPIAQSRVGPQGRFEATFPITRAMAHGGPWAASGLYTGPIQPLLIEAYEGSSPGVGPRHAYATAALVVYSS